MRKLTDLQTEELQCVLDIMDRIYHELLERPEWVSTYALREAYEYLYKYVYEDLEDAGD